VERAVVSLNIVDFGLQYFDGTERKSIFELAFQCVSWFPLSLSKGEGTMALGFFSSELELAYLKALSPRSLV